MRILRVNQGKAFSIYFRLLFILLSGAFIVLSMLFLATPFAIGLSILLSLAFPASWFATNLLIVNLEENHVFHGIWTMGVKFGQITTITSIESVAIEKIKTKQTVYSMNENQHLSTGYLYRAYLVLDSGRTFFLISHPIEKRIIEKCQQVLLKLRLSQELLVLPDQ